METVRRIQQLPIELANQIAAGEVVERPASIVKELLENSLDAKAKNILIECDCGGMRSLKVQDDGVGIPLEDLPLALTSHATSKIHTVEELMRVSSLGFRGEALASINSVSKLKLSSRVRGEKAWQIVLKQGAVEIQPTQMPFGTIIEVRDLFFNIPARRKFIKTAKTEFHYIEECVKRIALSHYDISITLKHNDKLSKHYPAVTKKENFLQRVGKVCGESFATHAIWLDFSGIGIRLWGYLGMPELNRRTSDLQYFYVNGRMVKDKVINHAIKSVFSKENCLAPGCYPAYVLYLEIEPAMVDVNVHPTKYEVRFSESRLVHDFLTKCIFEVLQRSDKKSQPLSKISSVSYERDYAFSTSMDKSEWENVDSFVSTQSYQDTLSSLEQKEERTHLILPPYYVTLHNNQLCILDLEKAKMSLLQFYFHQGVERNSLERKPALFPLRINLHCTNQQFILDILKQKSIIEIFYSLGLEYRWVNEEEILVQAFPTLLSTSHIQEILIKVAEQLSLHSSSSPLQIIIDALSEEVSLTALMKRPLVQLEALIKEFLNSKQKNEVAKSMYLQLSAENITRLFE